MDTQRTEQHVWGGPPCTSACQPRVPWSPAYIYTRGNGPGAHGEAAAAAATCYGCGLQLPGFLWLVHQPRPYYGVLKRSVQSASQCNPNAASQALPAKPPAPWPQDQSISAQAYCSNQRDGNAEVSYSFSKSPCFKRRGSSVSQWCCKRVSYSEALRRITTLLCVGQLVLERRHGHLLVASRFPPPIIGVTIRSSYAILWKR